MLRAGEAGELIQQPLLYKIWDLGFFFSPATPSRSESMCFVPVQILSYLGGKVKVEETLQQHLPEVKVKVEETELKPRIGFLYDIFSHNISVFINATREQDSGQYMCSVNVEDDTIRLDKNMGVINLTVLVPPAVPTCHLRGSAVVGANVTLICSSEKGKPSPMYQWQREPPTLQVFFPPAQDRARGTLKLTNLTLEMSGVYVCRAENQAGSKNCSIVLEVHSSEYVSTGLERGTHEMWEYGNKGISVSLWQQTPKQSLLPPCWAPWVPLPPSSSLPRRLLATGGKNVTARRREPTRSSEALPMEGVQIIFRFQG
uniref:Endothelial cell adhesion molecule n=1 Tax=Ficedula albicollis TaxID=59894 RepID=A0A803WCG5_FICAL